MIPYSLQEALRSRRVVPFVGAGVSMAVRRRGDGAALFPSWRGLLLAAARRLEQEDKHPEAQVVRGLVESSSPDLLLAAERAQMGLGSLWADLLKQQIDRSAEEADPASLDLAREVWRLGSRLVVTTNYDKVLRWTCPEPWRHDLDLWDIEAPAEQAHWMRRGEPPRPTVWHLHGRIDNASNLILTPDGYRRLYAGAEAESKLQAALQTLRTLLLSRSLLFLGFSLEDADFGAQLRSLHEIFHGNTGPHYALVRESDVARLHALKLPVEPVTFPGLGTSLLERLRELTAGCRDEPSAGGERSSRGSPGLQPPELPAALASAGAAPAAAYSLANRPFFVPFRAKGERVIGREAALQAVRTQLREGRPTSIGQTAAFQGLGGLGKTQLAVEYCWRYGGEYPSGVIWLTADQDISAQLTRLAVEAKWVAPASEHSVKLDAATHRLRSWSGCLIVFDNLEDAAAIEPYLPLPGVDVHLLATSRSEQPLFVPVPLGVLDPEQSLAMLATESGRPVEPGSEEQAARGIATDLHGLPLALEMAGAYVLRRSLTWQQYREILDHSFRSALRPELLASFTRHEADLYRTLHVQESVFAEEPLLREVLDVLTWSGSAAMGRSLLAALLDASEVDLLGALGLGEALRLLERPGGTARYGLHRLVRKVRQEQGPHLAERRQWLETTALRLGDWFAQRRQEFKNLAELEAEIDHLRAWQENAFEQGSPQAVRLLWLQAYPPAHRNQHAVATKLLERALELYETWGLEDLELAAWLQFDLGTMRSEEGKSQLALAAHERSLAIRRQVLGENHPDTASSLERLGRLYGQLGDMPGGLKLILESLRIRRSILGEQHRETASSLFGVSQALGKQGEIRKALDHALQALAILQSVPDSDDRLTSIVLQQIGNFHAALGSRELAIESAQQGLAIAHAAVGPEDPTTAGSLASLGGIYLKLRDPQTALGNYLAARETIQRALGRSHPLLGGILDNLGTCHHQLGDLEAALDSHRQALAINREMLGERNPATLVSVELTATILILLNRRSEAYDLIAPYLKGELPRQLKGILQEIQSKPLRPGFRSPSSHPRRKSKKH